MRGHLNVKNKWSSYTHCPLHVDRLEGSVPLILKAPSVILVINLNVKAVPL